MKRQLKVLIACEESQALCFAFRSLGHQAFSADLQKARLYPDWHIQGDVTPLLMGAADFTTQSGWKYHIPRWDLIICHPPCTYLCKVSSQWLYKEPLTSCVLDGTIFEGNWERVEQLKKAREFFYLCLNAPAAHVAVENPLPMAKAGLPKPTTFIQPSDFGVKYTKKTLLWLKNLPPILPTIIYPNPKQYVHCSRGKYRSRTFPQVAEAIALQWSKYILDESEL